DLGIFLAAGDQPRMPPPWIANTPSQNPNSKMKMQLNVLIENSTRCPQRSTKQIHRKQCYL
ncbi:unnamed protein product, partial [Alternaria alternata]